MFAAAASYKLKVVDNLKVFQAIDLWNMNFTQSSKNAVL